MKQFLGFTFLMGIIQKPNDPLYSTPIFKQVVKRDRCLLILKFLHFNNSDNMPDPGELWSFRPTTHSPEDVLPNLSVDSPEKNSSFTWTKSQFAWTNKILDNPYV